MVLGYKAFNSDLSNRYGQKFREKRIYHSGDKDIKFRKTGFHFCKRLEDTLRYYDGFSEIKIAKVAGFGEIDEYEDNYYGYYDMYSAKDMYIHHFLSEKEVVDYVIDILANSYNVERVIRFISGYKIDDDVKIKILKLIRNECDKMRVEKAIKYYQEGKKYVYNNPI